MVNGPNETEHVKCFVMFRYESDCLSFGDAVVLGLVCKRGALFRGRTPMYLFDLAAILSEAFVEMHF